MLLQLVRALWGGILLLAPRPLLRRTGPSSNGIVRLTRVLGARQLAEVAILGARHPGRPPRWPVIVDGIHGASMVAVAIASPRLRRDAVVSATVAGALAGWSELERRAITPRAERGSTRAAAC